MRPRRKPKESRTGTNIDSLRFQDFWTGKGALWRALWRALLLKLSHKSAMRVFALHAVSGRGRGAVRGPVVQCGRGRAPRTFVPLDFRTGKEGRVRALFCNADGDERHGHSFFGFSDGEGGCSKPRRATRARTSTTDTRPPNPRTRKGGSPRPCCATRAGTSTMDICFPPDFRTGKGAVRRSVVQFGRGRAPWTFFFIFGRGRVAVRGPILQCRRGRAPWTSVFLFSDGEGG